MADLNSVGDRVFIRTRQESSVIKVNISGTYSMTLKLRKSVGSPSSGATQEVATWSTDDATVEQFFNNTGKDNLYEVYVYADNSGTATVTIQEVEEILTSTAETGTDYINVKDYGAVGDGVIDDTAAIQAAIDTGYKKIGIPRGTYKVTSSLTLTSQQELWGVDGRMECVLDATISSGGILQLNSLYSDDTILRAGIFNMRLTGTAEYGIKLIRAPYFKMRDIRLDFSTSANVSKLTEYAIYIGNCWDAEVSNVDCYIETATTTPAKGHIRIEGAMNSTLFNAIRCTGGSLYGIHLSNDDSGGTEIPSGLTFNNVTIQRAQVGIYVQRARSITFNGGYMEAVQYPILLGKVAVSSDRAASITFNGFLFTSCDGTSYGFDVCDTAVVDAQRAYNCSVNGSCFGDTKGGNNVKVLNMYYSYNTVIRNPTRYNFAMSDLRDEVTKEASNSSTWRIEGNGTTGDQNIYGVATGAAEGVAVMHLDAAPTSGTFYVGDKVFDLTPTAGGTAGWVCTTGGTPGTWKTFGQVSN